MLEALRSFPPGSSGGLDGLTAQYILDMVSIPDEPRRLLLENLARTCDIIVKGRIVEGARDMIVGS